MYFMEYFGTDLNESGHFRFIVDGEHMVRTRDRFYDLPFNPEELTNNLPKGEVAFYQGGGFTVLAIAGGCKDQRPGTKSVFWVKEIVTRGQLVTQIMQSAPAMKIIRAMPFEVRWQL
jgi:hypothetical protein